MTWFYTCPPFTPLIFLKFSMVKPNILHNPVSPQVDQLLFEEGRFSPVSWLLANGFLEYGDYVNWRNGLIDSLDSCFIRQRDTIITQLKAAQRYAVSLGFESVVVAYTSTDQRVLLISCNPADDLIFKTDFEPAHDRMQLDLFFDSTPVCTENELITALIAGNVQEIDIYLDKLNRYDDRKHQDFKQLIELGCRIKSGSLSIQQKVAVLEEEMMPLSLKLLRGESLRFLTPLWRTLSDSLNGYAFRPQVPNVHISYTAAKAFQWQDVVSSIEQEPKWLENPLLLFRYAEASFKLNRELTGFTAWFQIFLSDAEEAEQLIKKTAHSLLSADWRRFQDLDPELETRFFPAWLLLIKPALARHDYKLTGDSEGCQAFSLVKQLMILPRERTGNASLSLRAELKMLNPGIFDHFIRAIL